MAGSISSRRRTTGWAGPSNWPEAIRNSSEYPICPAAPVTVTCTGGPPGVEKQSRFGEVSRAHKRSTIARAKALQATSVAPSMRRAKS